MTKIEHVRNVLKPNTSITLKGTSDGKFFARTFQIRRSPVLQDSGDKDSQESEVFSEGLGASVVCYEANHSDSGIGILKEFYPADAFYLQRNEENQLIFKNEAQEFDDFRKKKRKYLEPLQTLLKIKQGDSDNDFATFIPPFEIYYSDTQDGEEGTIYIWTPNPKLQTFEDICKKIHENPRNNPDWQLANVLAAIYSLTACVQQLHGNGLVHRDITPWNFGFVQRNGEAKTQAISLFDVNTIGSLYDNDGIIYATDGYIEENPGNYNADNKRDIYAIGATLFHAIVVNDEMKADGYCYREDYYKRLEELVTSSELILATGKRFPAELPQLLTKILKNCLAPRRRRYEYCQTLLRDLDRAAFLTAPALMDRARTPREKWILKRLNRQFKSTLPIQYHLFHHPLYRCAQGEDMHVLILGFGTDSWKFMDATLQNGQMEGKKLHVTVVAQSEEDKKMYLSDRPELDKFFDIDRLYSGPNRSYGSITFLRQKISFEKQKKDFSQFLEKICKTACPHYIFVALGEDEQSRRIARECRKYFFKKSIDCDISYLCEKTTDSDIEDTNMHPLCLDKSSTNTAFHKEIRRMAFNAHLIWNSDLRVDFAKIQADFKNPYKYTSSVTNVLSIKYKLYSLGIDIKEGDVNDLKEAARRFAEKKNGADGEELINKLMWLEHRRWVTEKACQGWRAWSTDQEIKDAIRSDRKDKQKDEEQKYHICMVPSLPNRNLEIIFGTDYQTWDAPDQAQVNQLDALDRLSLRWHQAYKRLANTINEQTLKEELDAIYRLIDQDANALNAFLEWRHCLNDIYHRDAGRDRLERGLREAFLGQLTNLSATDKNTVENKVKTFSDLFYPFLGRMELKNWKKIDADLIEGIPFILTYTDELRLAIPFVMGTNPRIIQNDQVFQNVAAAVVSNPKELCYLCEVQNQEELEVLIRTISYVTNFMNDQNLRARVRLLLAYGPGLKNYGNNPEDKNKLASEICDAGNKRIDIRDVACFFAADCDSATTQFVARMIRYTKPAFFLEQNNTALCQKLMSVGASNMFEMYRFDAPEYKFYAKKGCDAICYITKKPIITVANMIALQEATSNGYNQPVFFEDYKFLWKKYRERTKAWKILCNEFEEQCRDADLIGKIQKKKDFETAALRITTIRIPIDCKAGADTIVRFLLEHGFLERGSSVSGGIASCMVTLRHRSDLEDAYRKLFADDALSNNSRLYLNCDETGKTAMICSHKMHVDKFRLSENNFAGQKDILNALWEKGYLNNFKINNELATVSFSFADQQIKDLLTND